jgi:hypothetical protein
VVETGGGGGVGTCGVTEGCEEIFPAGGIRRGGPDRNIGKGYQCRGARGRGVGGWQRGHQQVVRPPMGAR